MSPKKATGKGAAKAVPVVVFKFGDGSHALPLVDAERQLLKVYARMAASDDPSLREAGLAKLDSAARQLAAARMAQIQKAGAAKSAAVERTAEAASTKLLAVKLAGQVSAAIVSQGKEAIARAVKAAAGRVNPKSAESERLAGLGTRQIQNLIFAK